GSPAARAQRSRGAEPGAAQPAMLVDQGPSGKVGACENGASPIGGTGHQAGMAFESRGEPIAEFGRLRVIEHRLLQLFEDESGGDEEASVGSEVIEGGEGGVHAEMGGAAGRER